MYQVMARKWRPQTFEELVGQPHVARTLRNAVEAGRTAHAYIFAGVRGTGKTTVARILAKCLNCETGPSATPCNACTACREITEGRSMDVLEMDAASRTGVDDIRELQEVVSYAPVRDRYKVLILDEAHMLSKSAVNALLKTLEEPPPRVVFVLATTEIQKLLPTILSRCQVFEFRRVSPREIAAHLRKICDTERVTVSDAALESIARAGEGSVRDALSVLERVLAFCGDTIRDEDAQEVLGSVRTDVLQAMVAGLAGRDAAGMLRALDGLVEEGHDLIHFWSELIAVLRDLLLARVLPDRHDLLLRSREEALALAQASKPLSVEDLTRAYQVLADLEPGLKSSIHPRFLFEAGLIRLASLGAVRPIEEILGILGGAPTAAPASPGNPAPARTEPGVAPGPASRSPERGEFKDEALQRFRAAAHKAKPLLGAAIEQASSVTLEEGAVVLAYPSALDPVRRMVEREDSLTILRRCAGEVTGKPTAVRVESAPARPDTGAGPAVAPQPEGAGARKAGAQRSGVSSPPHLPPDRKPLLDRVKSEPGIRQLLSEFGAQVVEIRPLDPPREADAEVGDGPAVEESP